MHIFAEVASASVFSADLLSLFKKKKKWFSVIFLPTFAQDVWSLSSEEGIRLHKGEPLIPQGSISPRQVNSLEPHSD